MSNHHLLLGPPGCGKTFRCLDIMAHELEQGVRPDRIVFTSFTTKATDNARDRMMERFGFTKQDLPYCRTIHSLAFRRHGLQRNEVMQGKNYKELGKELGLTFAGRSDLEEGIPSGSFTGDRYTFLDGFARARCLSPADAWRQCLGDGDEDLNWFEFRRFRDTLAEYKSTRGMLDFSDMLEYPNAPMDVDVVIIDEAQDLSTLQWDFVNKAVIPNAKRVYYAGDDDQAIYQWSGADVQAFQHLPGNREVLHQSHRVPISVHRVAEGIAHGIKNRYAKTYKPKPEAGSVSYHLEPDAVDLSTPGSWLLLARNIHLLPQLVAMVRAQGLPYSYRGESAINSNYVLAIKAWEKRRKGGEPSMEGWEVAKSLLPKGVSMEGKIWHEALVKIPLIDREWLIGILRRGESLTKVPRINIGTIHSVKGGEATNILLLTDMSAKTYNSAQIDHDSEARVWYVAATRAKQNLHIIQPQSRMGYEL